MFLVTVGIIALLSMQPMSWQAAGKSDFLGKAAEILQNELATTELLMMNPNNTVNTGETNKTVYASGGSGPQYDGDAAFQVKAIITDNGNNSWTVAATVTDPRSNAISESIIVTRQEPFKY
jgi:Tfp pilus assembly protein PilV